MTDTRLADVSEFQTVDWPAYNEPAVIIRALYGTSHVDNKWDANIAGARNNKAIRCRGIYQYIVAGQDIVAQANAFVRTVQRLLPGEFALADIEEGSGDLQARFETWVRIVHQGLGGDEGEYSGAAFAAAHLESFKGARFAWVAAYQSYEPSIGHQLWQNTDAERFAGISAPCDGSIFHGTIDNLLALIGAPTTPEAPMSLFDAAHSSDQDRGGVTRLAYISIFGAEPSESEWNFCKWCLGAGSGLDSIVSGLADSKVGQAARAKRSPQPTV